MVIQRRRRLPGRNRKLIKASTGRVNGPRGFRGVVFMAMAVVWMVRVEVADVLPGVTDAGEKVAVAPVGSPMAASVTGLEKAPFCAATVIVNCALDPGCMVCGNVVELTAKVGITADVPVPLSAVVCGEPDALSATESVAEKLAADAGVNVT
jgi:hypothetical protein